MSMLRVRIAIVMCSAGLMSAAALPAVAQNPENASARGIVMARGQPVAGAVLTFHPAKGEPTVTKTQSDGMYSVTRIPPGRMRVTIVHESVPPIYASPKTTPLAADVKPGQNAINFMVKPAY